MVLRARQIPPAVAPPGATRALPFGRGGPEPARTSTSALRALAATPTAAPAVWRSVAQAASERQAARIRPNLRIASSIGRSWVLLSPARSETRRRRCGSGVRAVARRVWRDDHKRPLRARPRTPRIKTPAEAGAFALVERGSDARTGAGDAVDLEARDAEVVELAVGELGQLANRLAIIHISGTSTGSRTRTWGTPFLAAPEGAGNAAPISCCNA